MRRIAIFEWIAPFIYVSLLFRRSIFGNNGFEAFCVKMRLMAKLYSADLVSEVSVGDYTLPQPNYRSQSMPSVYPYRFPF